jgi:twitching motility protein PilU
MIDYRNQTQHGHILTIEDPIEYLHPYKKSIVNQREVGTDTKSFAAALRNAMREAPDVILIGEIRDEETMHSALAYSETGHLCLATIHASNAIETLDRALNFFPERRHKQVLTDLSRNLKAVLCQRLVRGKDKRRWPALELLMNSPYIAELILKGELEEIRDAMSRKAEHGTLCFDDALLSLYQQQLISREDAINHADSRHNLTVKIRLLEHGRADATEGSGLSSSALSIQDEDSFK